MHVQQQQRLPERDEDVTAAVLDIELYARSRLPAVRLQREERQALLETVRHLRMRRAERLDVSQQLVSLRHAASKTAGQFLTRCKQNSWSVPDTLKVQQLVSLRHAENTTACQSLTCCKHNNWSV